MNPELEENKESAGKKRITQFQIDFIVLYEKTELDDLYLHWCLTEQHHNAKWRAPHQKFYPHESLVWKSAEGEPCAAHSKF
jgi:hypothetical protein